MQDQKKNEKVIQKPQKFVPQAVKVAPLDDITAQIESLVSTSTSERMYKNMYAPIYDTRPVCDIDCQCFPCRRGECGGCTGVVKRGGYDPRYDPRYGPSRF